MRARGPILVTVAGHLYWIVLVTSLWVLLRGHNEPGGGFIGGLIAVSASVVLALARDADAAARRMPGRGPLTCALFGVGVAAASGLVGPLVGAPFLTHPWTTVPLGFAELPVSSVLVFDVGVYLCVWGAVGGYALELLALEEAEEAP